MINLFAKDFLQQLVEVVKEGTFFSFHLCLTIEVLSL